MLVCVCVCVCVCVGEKSHELTNTNTSSVEFENINITRIAHLYRTHITAKSTLEYKIKYDENSDIINRTQVQIQKTRSSDLTREIHQSLQEFTKRIAIFL